MINIAKDFTRYPAGRYRGDWPYSGEAFREKFLKPVLKSGGNATVVFDGAMGYGSSFLEEAFAGLIREGFSKREIQDAFQLVSEDDPSILIEIEGYLTEPTDEMKNDYQKIEDVIDAWSNDIVIFHR